jgi:plasmid stabilization system protein ParE
MSRFIFAPAARQDLREIQSFIARESVAGARRVMAEIHTACARLAENPHLGHRREDLTDQPVLFWPVRAYFIIYQPETTPLEIVRVLHGARDIPNLL